MNQADQLEQVRAALDTVTDPEIDEPVTTLKFVSSVRVSDDNDVPTGRHKSRTQVESW
jgi:metal-sulfur cluster biosynthetic enzyme